MNHGPVRLPARSRILFPLILLVAACAGGGAAPVETTVGMVADSTAAEETAADSSTVVSTTEPSEDTSPSTTATSAPGATQSSRPASCEPSDGVPFRSDASVTLEPLDNDAGLGLFAAEYPLPGPTEGLWSQWGQGIVAPTGLHYSALGDHLGADGNSYIYEYDPVSRTLTRVMDVLSLVDHQPGAWGYGKIHSQMVLDDCGSIWAFTYWGTRRDIEYGNGYEGDLLLEIDPHSRAIRNHGAVVGERGVPSLIGALGGQYIVAEAVEAESDDGELYVFDTATGEAVHQVDDPDHIGFRSLAVDSEGRVLYSVEGAQLRALDVTTGETSETGIEIPGEDDEEDPEFLRAATPVLPDGYWYGATQESDQLFRVSADGEVEVLADTDGYTASLAYTPEGDRIFWLPGAHGSSWETGANVLAYDTATGEVTEVISLLEPFEELGLLPGGTYSITYHEESLILGVNASTLDDDSGFGTVVLVVIEGV
jgi:hypothetical protein